MYTFIFYYLCGGLATSIACAIMQEQVISLFDRMLKALDDDEPAVVKMAEMTERRGYAYHFILNLAIFPLIILFFIFAPYAIEWLEKQKPDKQERGKQ